MADNEVFYPSWMRKGEGEGEGKGGAMDGHGDLLQLFKKKK